MEVYFKGVKMTLDDKISMAMGTDTIPIRLKYIQKLPSDEVLFVGITGYLVAGHRDNLFGKALLEWEAAGGWITLAELIRHALHGWEHKDYTKVMLKLKKKSLIICKENIVNPDMPVIKLNIHRVWEDLLDG